jgi:hypothetical protein
MPFALLLAATLAADRFEPLRTAGAGKPSCTADRSICVAADDAGRIAVTRSGAQPVAWQVIDESDDSEAEVVPGPSVMRLRDGGLIVTTLVRQSQMYSGGGATAVDLRLALLRPGQAPAPLLAVPHSSDVLIRACFSEEDLKNRLEACHDNYALESRLSALPRSSDGLPDLAFKMTATVFPRGVRRDQDSLTLAPLTKADLVRETDTQCTLTRTFRFDAARTRYVPDRPLPACEAYTQP